MKGKIFHSIVVVLFISCVVLGNSQGKLSPELEKTIRVEVNKNIETVGIILCLSDLGDYVLEKYHGDYTWVKILRKRFSAYKNHPAVIQTNALDDYGLLHFGNYYYGLVYSELPEFKKQYARENPYQTDSLGEEELAKLLAAYDQSIRDFYKDANVEKFFDDNRGIYQEIQREITSALPQNILPTMEAYFGQSGDDYVINPSLAVFTGWNFGPNIVDDTHEIYYYILGPAYGIDEKYLNEKMRQDSLGFDDSDYVFELAIHEFGHSFVSFLEEKKYQKEIAQLQSLNTQELIANLEAIGEGTSWQTAFEEHLVRANEIMIWKALGKDARAKEKMDFELNHEGLIYIREFVKSLENYQKNRKKYPTMESYFPVLIHDINNIQKEKK